MTDQYHDIASYPAGIVNHSGNLMASEPNGTLVAGENVELTPQLRTRPGYVQMSHATASGLPAGEIMAMRQVRFPTNETSCLVVQVAEGSGPGSVEITEGTQTPPWPGSVEDVPRVLHAVAYDSQDDYIWVYGGASDAGMSTTYNDLWYFDRADSTWHLVDDATNHPAHTVAGHEMIYDAANHRLVAWGGYCYEAGVENTLLEGVWRAYDIATNTWSELTTSGDELGGRYDFCMVYRSAAQSVIVLAGWRAEQFYPLNNYYELDLTTLVGTATSLETGPGSWDLAAHHGAAYDPIGDTLTCLRQDSGVFWQLDLATPAWTELATLDVGVEQTLCQYPLSYCSDRYYALSILNQSETVPEALQTLWVCVEGTWAEGTIDPDIAARDLTRPLIAETDLHLVLGIVDPLGAGTAVQGIDIISGLCTYDPTAAPGEPGEVDPATLNSWLYACDDHLPTTTGTFVQIYDLGVGAGVCSFAVLNDRLVITEGVTNPPLVTGLSLSTDASDWLVPKAVLVQQAGDTGTGTAGNYYDVSPQVCDKDPDSIANIGNIRSSGALYVCLDQPLVEAVWFEMETPNTLAMTEGPRAYSATVDFTEAGDLNRQDLKGTIDHWVQDSGATGHFEDAGNTPLTLGAGNACPDVEEGLEVVLAGGTRWIASITPDGEGAGEVELSAATTSQAVTGIYGLRLSGVTLSVKGANTTPVTINDSSAYVQAGRSGGVANASFRDAMGLAGVDASHIRLTFKATDDPTIIGGGPLAIVTHVSIVEAANAWTGTTTPTEVTFNNGESGFTSNVLGETITSDIIAFTYDHTKLYLVTWDIGQSTVDTDHGTFTAGWLAYIKPGSTYYQAGTAGTPAEYWDQIEMPHNSFTGYQPGFLYAEIMDTYAQPTTLFVAVTTDTSHSIINYAEDFVGVAVVESKPGGSTIWHAVSFDERDSFSVFLNDAWRSIVQYESATTWQYKDALDAWQNAATNDMYSALREAFAVTENQMTGTQLNAITQTQWKDTGGVVVKITPALDFAVGLTADGNDCPTVTSYTVTVSDYGTTHVYGWQAGAWAAGDGWDDNTVVSEIPWSQSGTVEYLGATPMELDYSVLNEVPGYWLKFVPSGTSSDCAITRILYKAPCQPLSNIGDGQPDVLMGMIFENGTTGEVVNFWSYSGDNVTSDVNQEAIGAMTASDYLYLGYVLPFNAVSFLTYQAVNTDEAVLSAEYWNGEAWTAVTVTDGTSSGGKTFATVGKVEWSIPTDWRTNIPFDGFLSRGYWIRLAVSSTLSSGTSLGEIRVYSVPPPPSKHRFVEVAQDRVMLACRPDAWDQVDISSPLTEYDFISANAGSFRVGGMDQIQAIFAAWNSLIVAKRETLHRLIETANGYAFEALEAARLTPINAQVVVKGPASMGDDGGRSALYFVNAHGAFVLTGFSSDEAQSTGRNVDLSGVRVNWWSDDTAVFPRIDKRYLHKACGEFWPIKNWIVWSVPMILEGTTVQTTNNRLIVLDLNQGIWLPPFTLALSALRLGYDYSATATGKTGPVRLYGGTYDGRVLELLGDTATTDGGTAIAAWATTPWMQLNGPTAESLVRNYWAFGDITGTLTLNLYADGDAVTPKATYAVTSLDGSGSLLKIIEAFNHMNAKGRWWQFKFSWSGPGRLDRFGILAEVQRQDMRTG